MKNKEYIKTCKNCGDSFRAFKSTQKVCGYDCAIEYAKTEKKRKELKEWGKRKKVIKEELKTVQQLMKEAQVIFNAYIRERDKGKPCVSCGNILEGKFDAGHYFSSGGHKAVTFDEENVHGQCVACNQHKHGNLLNYQIGIEKRIGGEALIRLHEEAHKTKKYTREELRELKQHYKQKIKCLKNK